jgi:hypothetical protein
MLKKLGIIMSALMLLAGCGSGHSGIVMPLYTTATLKISLPTPAVSKKITGTEFIMTLPAGVTPALEADGKTVSASVVTPSGTFAISNGGSLGGTDLYVAATSGAPGTLYIPLANAAGVDQGGEVATVTLKLSGFTTPSATSFPFSLGLVFDMSSTPSAVVPTVSGLTLH